ncbi:hypothetical protein ACP4OV_012726 [Aristida adscensionis]
MEATRKKASPISPAAASAAAILAVLGDENLLAEIFLRLALPTNLVRAAAACRLWYHVASDPAFLRRFRDLHPPRLLGFYLSSLGRKWDVDFVPMLPQPPELAAVVRRAGFRPDVFDNPTTRMMNCRNGSVPVGLYRDGKSVQGFLSPLHPARGMVDLPSPPAMSREDERVRIFREIVCKEDGDGRLKFLWLSVGYSKDRKVVATVYMLQDDGAWSLIASATTPVPRLQGSALKTLSYFLADDKIYMGLTVHNILVLDLKSSAFSTINFPDRVSFHEEMVLSPAEGSGVYLVHVSELQLRIWLHKAGNGSTEGWLLIDTIGLRDMYANLRTSNGMTEVGGAPGVYIHEVGDNAEFAFLEMCGCIVYLDVRSRAMRKVYNVAEKDSSARVCWIHPFKMIWPPTFPRLKNDPARLFKWREGHRQNLSILQKRLAKNAW